VSGTGGFDAADQMRQAIRRVLLEAARAEGAEVRERGMWSAAVTVQMAEPLAGIRYARIAEDAAKRLVEDYVAAARADGRTWLEIAGALGLSGDDRYDLGVEAFNRVAGNVVSGFRPASFYWRCPVCGKGITEYGPFEANPVNTQSGHAEGCERLAAEAATYRADWGDDE
jgi:hypothetical protein